MNRKSFLPSVIMFLMLMMVDAGAKSIYDAIRDDDILAVDDILIETGNAVLKTQLAADVTPLHFAAALNRKVITGMLLSRGADVNSRTEHGFTPLHWAASKDAVDAARLLVEFGADVDAVNDNGVTPLHWAAGKNAVKVVKLLVAEGARTNMETDKGLTPLDWAVKKGRNDAALIISYKMASDQIDKKKKAPVMDDDQDEVKEPALPVDESVAVDVDVMEKVDIPEDPVQVEDLDKVTPADDVEETVKSADDVEEVAALDDPEDEDKVSVMPRTDYGKALSVALGFNETLKFVWIDKLGIWFGKYEVTNGQFKRYRPKHRSMFRDEFSLEGDDQPVVHVSWKDAKEYCSWLNKEYVDFIPEGCRFRLPTATEWTTVAGCGDDRKYPWGDKWPPAYGNYFDLTGRRNISGNRGVKNYDDGWIVTCPVAQSGSNEWGVFGLAGNVWEWCEDWYESESEHKIRRGGSWYFDSRDSLEVDVYGFDRPESHDDTIGFRLVVDKVKKLD